MDPKQPQTGGEQAPARARRFTEAFKGRALARTEDKKIAVAAQIATLADKLEGISTGGDGSEAGLQVPLLDRGVGMLRNLQRALDANSTEDLIAKAHDRIRARPEVMVAGCVALGFLGARLLRR
jgi:hypothetical protein